MTKMIMDDKNHLYLSEKSRMIDSLELETFPEKDDQDDIKMY